MLGKLLNEQPQQVSASPKNVFLPVPLLTNFPLHHDREQLKL
ncbi:hypothetical protein VCHC17A1_4054 [Vibrio cholerae HC-17A1]|nr:hypothetical protein VCHC17A1_4054 [Vibrio cholerae HC-17A1]